MTKRNPATDAARTSSYALPRWELQRRHRLLLDRRVRAVRRSLFAGGVVGTIAFSVLAGYETRFASDANAGVPAAQASVTQGSGFGFFAGQASPVLRPATPTSTAPPTETSTPTATVPLVATTAPVTTAPQEATATAVPTDTPTPVVEDPSAPSSGASFPPPTRTQSSN